MEGNSVLVIGSGGREHTLSWKLAQSELVQHVYVAPGNAGTYKADKIDNISLDVKDFDAVVKFCREKSVSLVVVGPEDPLAAGIADHLNSAGISCFGPSREAAQIEASKEFAKQFMIRHNIPTARYKSFTDAESAFSHINQADYAALVVKASGLAAGKGVIVAGDREEACQAVHSVLTERKFGAAGDTVIVEELLQGEEVSVLAFTDGYTVAVMPPAQDHKTLYEGDSGPNTGGMGVICPYSKLTEEEIKQITQDILQKAVDGMRADGRPYIGVLYAGLMLTSDGPKVLEFNCRFGDPETQGILSLLRSDLYQTCKACTNGILKDHLPVFDLESCTVGVVVVSGGYPGSYKKGLPISGLENVRNTGLQIFHAGTTWRESQLVTSGGRVLCVVSTAKDYHQACSQARAGAALVTFQDAYFRQDIGYKMLTRTGSGDGLTYKDAGVDIDAGNSLVDSIKPLAASTRRAGCSDGLGGFGAMFDLKAAGYTDPVLVSGTDGVGTKLKVAQTLGKHNTIGIDLVAMCVNDILAQGAEPLYFLDYFATGKLSVAVAKEVIDGIARGCKIAGCALVGGETAEMPGMYSGSDYDLAGFAVGAMERGHMLPRRQDIKTGDAVIGLKSSGIHSNGFSLVRKVIEKLNLNLDAPSPLKTGKTLGDDLLTPTRIYVKDLLPHIKEKKVKAVAHITGGGLTENIPRVLPDNLGVTIDALKWDVPAVFGWLADKGNISDREMLRTFNCGIGAVLIVDSLQADDIVTALGDQACIIGQVETKTGDKRVALKNLCPALIKSWQKVPGVTRRKKVGVLISGSGTNLQALIDHTTENNNNSCAEIGLVISNKPDVQGLTRAKEAGINTMVINHKDYKSREDFDQALHQALIDAGIEIVCLAGFMRILTGDFVNKWTGRMLNIHPSLLPSFKGHDAHKQVIKANVRISGCTVHFVAEEVDGGAILVQESVPVYPGDTEESLSERIKKVEHRAFPRALELVASEQAVLRKDGIIEWCQ